MKTLSESQISWLKIKLQQLEEDMSRHYPPAVERVACIKNEFEWFVSPVIEIRGEVVA